MPKEMVLALENPMLSDRLYLPRRLEELVAEQAERTPDRIAVVHEGEQLSYGELERRSERVGWYLRRKGVRAETRVGVSLERGVDLVVALLGVLQSGGAYVGLDPAYPEERLQYMLADSEAKVVLSRQRLAEKLQGVEVVWLEKEEYLESGPESECGGAGLGSAAYVIYTSGSTGKPKGVVIEQGAASWFVQWARERYGSGETNPGKLSRVVAGTSICFDLSIFELFGPLVSGGLVVLSAGVEVGRAASRSEASLLNTVPSVMRELVGAGELGPTVEVVNLAGEALGGRLVREVYESGRVEEVYNLYGPTEATTYATGVLIARGEAGEPTIGQPLTNVRAYVVDEWGEPVPVGVAGELWIGGAGLARGYLNQPGQTAEKFVPDGLSGRVGQRLYRTGDLARWRGDGNLEFLGRLDHQVKVRGYRIELGEIESALKAHQRVQDALVKVNETGDDKVLAAYIIANPIETEPELAQASYVCQWKDLWDSTYRQQSSTSPDFNLAGWMSSYTGEPIPADDMRLWLDGTVDRIRLLRARHVLEIGCGSGLLLTRLAGGCDRYVGLDFSAPVLNQLGNWLSTRPDLGHVVLREGEGRDLSFLSDASVDLVILNSVAQCFPDMDYLLDVLQEAVRVTRTGGRIFVGDVRNVLLHEAFHASVQLHRAKDETPSEELRIRVMEAQRKDKELLVDAELFRELAARWPRVGRADIALKPGVYDNELSRFRYDVTLQIGDKDELVEPDRWLTWSAGDGWEHELIPLLDRGLSVGVRGIRDWRAAPAICAAGLLQAGIGRNALDVRAACTAIGGEEPDKVMQLARRLGVQLCWQNFGAEGLYDAVFNARWRSRTPDPEAPRAFYRRLGKAPSLGADDAELGRILQEYLREKLPQYMVPSMVAILPAWPLTPNGKVDRNRLPVQTSLPARKILEKPRTPIEEMLAGVWAHVLNLESVGATDNFFDLGGHSLLAARVIARVREAFGIEMPLRVLFEHRSLREFAAEVEKTQGAECSPAPAIAKTQLETAPASPLQRRLWFIQHIEPSGADYNVPYLARLEGPLDIAALRKSLREIVRRHETLRTRFVTRDGEPWQEISGDSLLELPLIELQTRAQGDRLIAEESRRPFDLSRAPVIRARLLCYAGGNHELLLTIHHIAMDAWSLDVLTRELSALYNAFSSGQPSPLSDLPARYIDYSVWLREWLQAGVLDRQLGYWKKQLDGAEPLELPTSRPHPGIQCHAGARLELTWPPGLDRSLNSFNRREEATLFITVLTAFSAILSRYSGQRDLLVGTPISARSTVELESLIGFFVNTLAVRTDTSGNPSFRQLLGRVREAALGAYAHQDVPFEKIVEELRPERHTARTPLVQAMLVVQHAARQKWKLAGKNLSIDEIDNGFAKFDLTLSLTESGTGLRGDFSYSTAVFDEDTIGRFARHFIALLDRGVANPNLRIGDLPLLNEVECRQILVDWNNTAREYRRDRHVHQLFEDQCELTPQSIAVVHGENHVSYRELNRRANRLAHYLLALDTGLETRVALYSRRNVHMVVGIMAALKSGAAYVPLDANLPPERLAWMLADAQPRFVLTEDALCSSLPERSIPSILIDRPETAASCAAEDPESTIPPQAGAYIIYTSGSTGRPKGVVIEHRQILNHVLGASERVRFPSRGTFALVQPLAVDGAATFIFAALGYGGCLHLISEHTCLDPQAFAAYMESERIDCLKIAPSHLIGLQNGAPAESLVPNLRLIVGGEASKRDWLLSLHTAAPECLIFNNYGPTETTVGAVMHSVSEDPIDEQARMIPLGRPLANVRTYVLDADGLPVPIGVKGDLHIGGAGVGRGYLGRPGLTAEKFIPDPFSGEAGGRIYRTGDLVRLQADGVLDFMGREDDQVKIRGYRVELGEIEAALARQPGVRECAAAVHAEGHSDSRLVGYVVWDKNGTSKIADLRILLARQLPEHMLPTAWVEMDKLPLSPQGKLARKLLPAPDPASPRQGLECAPPRTPTEELLAGIWADALKLERIGIHDNFFESGGHSLLAMQIVSRVRKSLGIDLSLWDLLRTPTVAAVATVLDKAQRAGNQIGSMPVLSELRPSHAPLTARQGRLWNLHRLTPGTGLANVPLAVTLHGALDIGILRRSLREIVSRHEILRTTFPVVDGVASQKPAARLELEIPLIDLSALGSPKLATSIARLHTDETIVRPFDVEAGPLLRFQLTRLQERTHVFTLVWHFLITDGGMSTRVLLEEFIALYEAFASDKPSPLPKPALQFAEIALWEQSWIGSDAGQRQLQYWRERLKDVAFLNLTTDRPPDERAFFPGTSCRFVLPRETSEAAKAFSRREGITPWTAMLACYQLLLSVYTGQNDVAVVTDVVNRPSVETEELIGPFLNYVVLRTEVSPGLSFRQLVQQAREVVMGAFGHHEFPFEKILLEIAPDQATRLNAFPAEFGAWDIRVQRSNFAGIGIRPFATGRTFARFPLNVTVSHPDKSSGFWVVLKYREDLFTQATIDLLKEQFEKIAVAVMEKPDDSLDSLAGDLRAQWREHWSKREYRNGDPGGANFMRPLSIVSEPCSANA
jgi:amino acid adenylation domain-containing protein